MARQWMVTIRSIVWDDCCGDYDVSDLPTEIDISVRTEDDEESSDAIEYALCEASDTYGFMIESSESAAALLGG